MFPIYMWVKEYKGLKDFEITFDNDYLINIKDGVLSIEKKLDTMNISNFYSNNIESINLLIGKNGAGKTSILELLVSTNHKKKISDESVNSEELRDYNITDFSDLDYLIIYKNYSKELKEKFLIEKYNKKNVGNSNNFKISIQNTSFGIVHKILPKNKKILIKKDSNKLHDFLKRISEFQKIGIVKFNLFNSKYDNILELIGEDKIKKIYFNIEIQSKEKIYTYINIQKKNNKENFENAKMIISIKKDIYSNSKYYNEIMHFWGRDELLDSNFDNELILCKINEDDSINDIILKNYCNKFFLMEISNYITRYNIKDWKEDTINIIKRFKKNTKKDSNSPKKILKYSIENLGKNSLEDFYKNIIAISENMEKLVKNKAIIMLTDDKKEGVFKFSFNFDKCDKEILEFLKIYDSFKILDNKEYRRLKEASDEYIGEIISIYEEGFSDGEKIKLQYYSSIYTVLEEEFRDKKYITLLFDEVEAFLHPEWSRIFLYELIKELEEKYPEKKFKLIFATHSPFLIADVLAKDCIYLEKENGKIEARIDNNKKTFGANIFDLFKNTMFLESTFGKFATEKIKWLVNEIDSAKNYSDIKNNPEINYILEYIGEKLMSNKLNSRIESKLEDNDKEYYKNKIKEYEAKIKKIEEEEGKK